VRQSQSHTDATHPIFADPSRSADGTGLRVSDRNSPALPLRQAAGQLYRAGSGRLQQRSTATGTHQQARQCAVAVSVGRSSAGHHIFPQLSRFNTISTFRCFLCLTSACCDRRAEYVPLISPVDPARSRARGEGSGAFLS